MKVRNILKGIGKLVLATSLMCGIGLFLRQDVKAAPTATIDRVESDGSIVVKVKLSVKTICCPYCKGKVKIHDYTTKKLTHSVLANRNCIICFN